MNKSSKKKSTSKNKIIKDKSTSKNKIIKDKSTSKNKVLKDKSTSKNKVLKDKSTSKNKVLKDKSTSKNKILKDKSTSKNKIIKDKSTSKNKVLKDKSTSKNKVLKDNKNIKPKKKTITKKKKTKIKTKILDDSKINVKNLNGIINLQKTYLYSINSIKLDNFELVKVLILNDNYLINLGDSLKYMVNLVEFNASTNNIKIIENLNNCINLKKLNLSFNIINSIQNIDFLVNLKYLDLSFNNIRKIENMKFPFLTVLNLNNNKIKNLENLEILSNLEELYFSHNLINECDQIIFLKDKLKFLDLSYNQIPMNYFNNFFEILKKMSKLNILFLLGNEISLVDGITYYFSQISSLISFNGYKLYTKIPKKIDIIEKQKNKGIDDVLDLAKKEYNKVIEYERNNMNAVLGELDKKKEKIKHKFDNFEKNCENDYEEFLKFKINLVNSKLRNNENFDIENIEEWKRVLKSKEVLRNQNNLKSIQTKYQNFEKFNNHKLINTPSNFKWYEISQKFPNWWKDLKIQQFQKSNKNKNTLAIHQKNENDILEKEKIQDLLKNNEKIFNNNFDSWNNEILNYDKNNQISQKKQAINKIVNNYNNIAKNNINNNISILDDLNSFINHNNNVNLDIVPEIEF